MMSLSEKNAQKAMSVFDGRDILITGGTGSFGKKFVEIILKEYKPRRVAIYSRDEMKHYAMREEEHFKDDRLRFFIGDVRDKERLFRALSCVDIVIHAAAMHMVQDAEYNPRPIHGILVQSGPRNRRKFSKAPRNEHPGVV